MSDNKEYGVIVIGAGHAGCEAAAASARMGIKTLLITIKKDNIGELSCNPAIGGVAKGTLVREIDALDGLMGRVIDKAGIHFRVLNKSKGAAVWGPRAQADRKLYKEELQKILFNYDNLDIEFDIVESLSIEDNIVNGVICKNIGKILAKNVILTTGTFLNGLIHIGDKTIPAGRVGEDPSIGLSESLKKCNFNLGRLKTGTPARLDSGTINWDILEEQYADQIPVPFSYLNNKVEIQQIKCFVTHTNENTHNIISDNIHKSAMYSGKIESVGPRYCPSIEDKITRFAHKSSHQIFLEKEGVDSNLVYPNGISTSLPADVQEKFIKSVKGLENVKITQPGYAIEYDYVDPRELKATLETKKIKNLFFAGQINGTTGYEEAGAQGLVAGVNAALKCKNENSEFIIDRSTAYIGVMIDDLIRCGTTEPYRMFTSRSEYRISLRADNADKRLTEIGYNIGCISEDRWQAYSNKVKLHQEGKELLESLIITPNEAVKHGIKIKLDGVKRSAFTLLGYKEVNYQILENIWKDIQNIDQSIKEDLLIDASYASYMQKQENDIKIFKKDENILIPDEFDYFSPKLSLSNEVRSKLDQIRPASIGAAGRISGVTPAALAAILVSIRTNSYKVA